MKKLLSATLTAILIVTVAVVCYAASYVGNARTYKFHYAGCRYVRMMASYNKVYFNDREDAIDEGFVPYKVCQP